LLPIALALLVSDDTRTIRQFSRALEELSILPEVCQQLPTSVRLLNGRKFDAVIVDLRLGDAAGVVLDAAHLSPSNRTAVTFAIGTLGEETTKSAFRKRVGFVFESPLSLLSVRNTLKASFGLILRERRRYFRNQYGIAQRC
jgi:DNA-binding NtrC family response regulator